MKNLYLAKLLFLFFFGISHFQGFSQVTGTKSIPGDYVTIAAAINDLNQNGVGTGGATFNITAGHSETGNLPILTATGTGTSPIIFQKSGTGVNPSVTASAGTGTMDGILRLQGTDYITFDGIDFEESSSNTTAATQMEWGIALLKASATDGCQFVTIKNCRIILNKANTASIGIYSGNHTPSATTALSISTLAGTNSYNAFYSNMIVNVYRGISLHGDANFFDTYNEIGAPNNGNLVSNFGGSTVATTAIYAIAQDIFKIANNTITGGNGTANILYGIHNDVATSANASITGNTVTIHGGGTTQALIPILNSAGSTPANNNTIEINNNIIQNCTYPTATSGLFYGIQNAGTAQNIKINGNTISGFTHPATGTMYVIYNSASNTNCNLEMENNIVNNISRTGTSGIIYGVYTLIANIKFNNNTISNISQAQGASALRAYYNISTTPHEEYYSNTIFNINHNGTGPSSGLYLTGGNTKVIEGNNIYSISTTSGLNYGIFVTIGTYAINKNKVHNLNTTTGTCTGVYVGAGTSTIANNIIGNLNATTSTSLTGVAGIQVVAGTACNIYYNTIRLASTSSGTDFGTSCVNNTGATNLVMSNNIFINKSTANGNGTTAVIRRSSNTLGALTSATNNNLYYVIYQTGTAILIEGTAVFPTLPDYKAHVAPAENMTIREDVPFASIISSAPNYLFINPTVPTMVESGALPITGFQDDFTSVSSRVIYPKTGQLNGGGFNPDLGAVEGDFTPKAIVDMAITSMASPTLLTCPSANSTVSVEIRNNANTPIDFAMDSIIVKVSATDPSGATTVFTPVIVNTGTLASNATQAVTVSTTYNMSAIGSYTFTSEVELADDADLSNNFLNPAFVYSISGGNATVSMDSVCGGIAVNFSATGNTGTIQWQRSTDNGATWANETGTGSTASIYTTTPTQSALYRALSCGTLTSNTVSVWVNNVPAPIATNVTRCGAGPVSMSATGTGTLRWYDAPTGGNVVNTGATFNTNLSASSIFYVEGTSTGTGGSDSLQTSYAGGTTTTTPTGLMFDINALTSVTVNNFSCHIAAGTTTVEVWYRPGSYVGFNSSSNGWTSLGTVTITSAGNNNPTFIPLNFNVNIPAGQTFAFNITSTVAIRYASGTTVGAVVASNNAIEVTSGMVGGIWSQTLNRVPNITAHYSTGCTSPRTQVTATITPAPSVSISATDSSLCQGDVTILSASSPNQDYVFSWSPSTGLTATTGLSVNAQPNTAINYTVSANDPNTGCANSASLHISVSPAPQFNILSSGNEYCGQANEQLSVPIPPAFVNLGTGTGTLTWGPVYINSNNNTFKYNKSIAIYTAAEIMAMGGAPGVINKLAWKKTTTESYPHADADIQIFVKPVPFTTHNTSPVDWATQVAGATMVYSELGTFSFTTQTGWYEFQFASPFYWNGIDNLQVMVDFYRPNQATGGIFWEMTPVTNQFFHTGASSPVTTAAVRPDRPNIQFSFDSNVSIAWSPTSFLSNDTIFNPIVTPNATTTYTATMINQMTGCSSSKNVTIVVNEHPVVELDIENSSCFGANNGELSAVVTNNIPGNFNYSWLHNPNANVSLLTGLAPGAYTVSVESNKGCVGTAQATITEPSEITYTLSGNDITCYGLSNGVAEVISAGGTGNHTFIWNNNPALNTPSLSGLAQGIYNISITDENGCEKLSSLTINEPAELVLNISSTNPICYGGLGQANVTATGGVGSYTYSWTSGQTTSIVNNLLSGTQTVTVSDNNGCQKQISTVITEPARIEIIMNVSHESCKGANNGSIAVQATGGTGFYNYLWNTGASGTIIANAAPGPYSINVKDSNGCEENNTATVNPGVEAPVPNFSFTMAGSQVSFIDQSAHATSWLWAFGDGNTSTLQNPVHNYSSNGSFEVKLTVTNSCDSETKTQTVTLVGIKSEKANVDLSVYPNPSRSQFTINFKGAASNVFAIKIMDYQGKIVNEVFIPNFNGAYKNIVDLSHLTSGVYLLQLTTDEATITRRLVLNK
jgi:hypothetical protein